MAQTLHSRTEAESYGVLAGWTHDEFSGRIDLRLQTLQSTRAAAQRDIDLHHIVMTPGQAVQLAHYLYRVTEQTPPVAPRRSWLARLLG